MSSEDESKNGFTASAWDAAKAEARQLLIKRAKRRLTITYSDLVSKVGSILFEPNDARFFRLLEEISTEEERLGRRMLTAVVIHKSGDEQPGPGFFELAERLGRKVKTREEFWITELNAVHDYWHKRPEDPKR